MRAVTTLIVAAVYAGCTGCRSTPADQATTPTVPTSPGSPPPPTPTGTPPPTTTTPEPRDAPDPGCATLGCLRAVVDYGTYSRADIAPYLYGGVTIDNGYAIYGVTYLTEDGEASTTVTLPVDLAGAAPPDGFPIVVNAHGTMGLDDPCQLTGTVSGTGLAALFGGRGAIGVAPDYPGLGTPGFARYLDARSEATSVLDAIRAAIHLARWRGTATNARAAVVGLSQGGHASLAAAALHAVYAPELDIRAFGASGPANLYEEQWRAGAAVPGEHLVLHAMLAWSFAEVTGLSEAERAAIWADALAPTVDDHLTTRCNWSPSFGPEALLADGFPTRIDDVFSPAFADAYLSGAWGEFAFMGERFDADRIRPWLDEAPQTAPIAIWQGTEDATVLPWMTEALVADLQAGGVDVELHLVDGGTHTTTAFGFLATPELATDESVAWVKAQLAGP